MLINNLEKFVKDYNNPIYTAGDLETKYNLSHTAFYKYARELNLPSPRRSASNKARHSSRPNTRKEIIQFKEDYQSLRIEEMLRKYNMSSWRAIQKWAQDFNCKRKKEELIKVDPKYLNKDVSYEELLQYAVKDSELHRKIKNYNKVINISIETKKPIILVFSSDWHIGHPGVDYKRLDKDINLIEKVQNLYVYLGGDLKENFIDPGKMSEMKFNQQPILYQNAFLLKIFEKIKNKILAVGTGNHTSWTEMLTGLDEVKSITDKLNLVYTEAGGLINLKVGNILYKIYRQHHYRFNSSFSPTHSVKQILRMGEADYDIGVLEHLHQSDMESFYWGGKFRIAIKTGSYKTDDEYARSRGFWGSNISNPSIILFPNEYKMLPFMDIKEAVSAYKGVK